MQEQLPASQQGLCSRLIIEELSRLNVSAPKDNWKNRPLLDWFLAALVRGLKWIGITVDLLIRVREGDAPAASVPSSQRFGFRFLNSADIGELIRLEPASDADELRNWFQEGKLCFGVWDESRLVAKMWCDLEELYYPKRPVKLADDEVYLLLAFVDPDYRGHGLASVMRAEGFAALRQLGRNKFYSYSRYFNTAARRFKAKLGAREEGLIVHFLLFGKWSRCIAFKWTE